LTDLIQGQTGMPLPKDMCVTTLLTHSLSLKCVQGKYYNQKSQTCGSTHFSVCSVAAQPQQPFWLQMMEEKIVSEEKVRQL